MIYLSVSYTEQIYALQWLHTLIWVPLALNSVTAWSSPTVDFGPVSKVKVLSMKRRKMELLPTPYSPHRITLNVGVLVAILGTSSLGQHLQQVIVK